MFKAKGYFEGSESEWKKSWQQPLWVVLIGLLIAIFYASLLGSIIVAIGLAKFGRRYFSGIGTMGMGTDSRPAEFCNVKRH